MKKVMLVLSLVFISNIILAQSAISKGSFTIGGNISLSSQSFENNSNNITVLSFNPKVGYFFFDNFYTAISVNYYSQSMGDFSNKQFGIGPSIRYYFDLDKIKPFVGLSYLYNEFTSSNFDYTNSTREIVLTGGMNIFVTNNFALETSINYSFIKYNLPSGFYLNDSGKSNLFQIAVGVNYFIY